MYLIQTREPLDLTKKMKIFIQSLLTHYLHLHSKAQTLWPHLTCEKSILEIGASNSWEQQSLSLPDPFFCFPPCHLKVTMEIYHRSPSLSVTKVLGNTVLLLMSASYRLQPGQCQVMCVHCCYRSCSSQSSRWAQSLRPGHGAHSRELSDLFCYLRSCL